MSEERFLILFKTIYCLGILGVVFLGLGYLCICYLISIKEEWEDEMSKIKRMECFIRAQFNVRFHIKGISRIRSKRLKIALWGLKLINKIGGLKLEVIEIETRKKDLTSL
jgi:hypothetical protein